MCPYNETFLIPHLKGLSSDQIIQLLKYMYYLFLKCSHNVEINLLGTQIPSFTQIIDWVSLLLDAHFTSVVMWPEAKKMLIKLQRLVRSQMKVYSELNKIEGYLTELQELKMGNRQCADYSIEVFELY
ncbi:hypothetical protein GDO86_013722 [Hymenochirus boettgeri]|uniref:Nucleolar protein 11 C-terminal domain-containing protein n=1 Tax=Hymenochirus boettgeri TaxID=247094 RepID=A0A8T2JQ95_9PIPI|nr:hypothetical protein GDO86_013722 [Hymenochirus boettgeri]